MASGLINASPALALTDATLEQHRHALRVPTYRRDLLVPSVVHLGVGGFHRAHQAVYFDDLAQEGVSLDWGIVGVGLRRPQMKAALEPQNCLFTVVERSDAGDAGRVVGSMRRYLLAPEDPRAVLAALCDERTRLVTLTVTGDGYAVGDGDRARPDRPVSPVAYLVEALARRRATGLGPITVLSCDNVPHNGRVTRDAVLSLARSRDELLARWIARHVSFPSSMVDRITPQTTDADRALLRAEFGLDDRWPVVAEPFTQWIVEDDFCNGRPPLDEVGVQFVDDVTPYQLMKNRLLNAGHSALGYLGALAGYSRTDDAIADPALESALDHLMAREVAPLLPKANGIDLVAYRRTLLERLANSKIGDPLARLCRRGSTKMPDYLLPSVVEAGSRARPRALLTLAVAAWFRYLRGTDCAGRPIAVKDPLLERLQPLATAGGCNPRPLLGERDVFGDLGDDEAFVAELARSLRAIDRDGVQDAVAAALPVELAGVA